MAHSTEQTDAQREQIAAYMRARKAAQAPRIPQHSRDGIIPLSFGQQQLWLLAQLQDTPVYSECVTIHMPGRLDDSALGRSFLELLRRHEAWRTSFPVIDGQPVQQIHPPPERGFRVVDLRSLPVEAREAEALRLATEEAVRPFDLENGPLLRATLMHLSATEHRLFLALHHIIFDGVSLYQIFLPELWAIYTAFLDGDPSPLPEPTLQYADYAFWQREQAERGEFVKHIDHWRKQLAGAPSVLELPTDRPHPAETTYHGATYAFTLTQELTAALKDLCRREGVTFYVMLLAALNTLLSRLSGQEDIVIGIPMNVRNRPELQKVMGYFLNTLVIRTAMHGNPTFAEVLQHTREVMLDAHAHQDLPFQELVQALQPERIAGRNPLFQAMLSLVPPASALPSGWKMTQMDVDTETAKFDLNVVLDDRPDGLFGRFEYNTDIFEAATVAQMAQRWIAILQSVATDATQRVAALPLLTPAERQRILIDWNETTQPPPPDICIHALFDAQAARTPDAPAVVYEDTRLTYAELNQQANQLAHHLRTLGIGPDELVGLYVDRSPDMIVGILGILKAGGAYVPIDPTYPADRVAFMLTEAQARVVVTHQHLAAQLPTVPARVVALDAERATLSQLPATNLDVAVTPANLVYVIFTSGSTGKPKGTMIEHRQLVNYTYGVMSRLDLPTGASYAHVSTIAGDLGNTCIFPALTSGGTIHVIAQDRIQDADALAEYMHQQRIDCIKLTPSHMAALLTAEHPTWALPRRVLVMGGEFAHWPLIERIHALAPDLRIVNHYGPTETTVGIATYAVNPDAIPGARTVPVGRPLPHSQMYVLDRNRKPVPVGATGELYIGGAGLARGYLHRPDLTEERFVQNPFSDTPGARLYRSGDQARQLADGAVELLGRQDNQVKIRGYRIELGEIEATLRDHPGVAGAAVLAREDKSGEKRLVAYVVPSAATTDGTAAYYHFLKTKLPEYMIPSAFVMLDALPLTANGKVDQRALPAPDQHASMAGAAYAPPHTLTEQALATVWEEVLDVARVSIHDDFFALGGNSLVATRLVARLRRLGYGTMHLRTLFAAPTVAALASQLDQQSTVSDLPALTHHDRAAYQVENGVYAMPPSFTEESLWFFHQLDPSSSVYNMHGTVRRRGAFSLDILQRSLRAMCRRHEILRSTFVMRDEQVAQQIMPEMEIPIATFDLRGFPVADREAEARRIVTDAVMQPFDLARGPLLRAAVLQLDADDYVLSFPLHHIIADGTAINVFLNEIATFYEAFAQGQAPSLPEQSVQYADFAIWQREVLRDERLAQRVDFWRQHLQGAPTTLNLPLDRPRPPSQSFRGARYLFDIPAKVMDDLRALSRREGTTVFVTLLAAMSALFHRYTNQDDILLGTPMVGRNQVETERLMGAFINSVVMRCDLAGNPTFSELLRRIQLETLQVLVNGDIPFDALVQQLQPERIAGQNPFFQAMLSYWQVPDMSAGWQQTFLIVDGDTAKFDLYFQLDDQEDGAACHCEYNTDLFDEATIVRMVMHWQQILAAVARDPDQRIAEVPLLSEVQRQQVLVEWNATARSFPQQTITQLFEAQATATPQAIAVVFEGQTLTYAELNQRANQMAHALRAKGVGAETLVGLCFERSFEMLIAVLGILKAGGAYLAIDPTLPPDRVAYMLEDAQVPLIVTQRQFLATLPSFTGAVLCVDEEADMLRQQSAANLVPVANGDALAYVIYTSGSTGRPKGVQITQRAVVNFLNSMRRQPGLTADDILLAITTLSFDISGLELFLPLIVGARIVLMPREAAMDGIEVAQVIARERVTVLQAGPTLWRLLLAAGWPGDPRLKGLCGGEALAPDLAQQLVPRIAELWNMYGPTETTIWSTACRITLDEPITIGRPIDNTEIYILDGQMQPVPVGVPGDLYIGGVGLARGYLRRPELTEERFIPHPFKAGERVYKTGDLASYRPNGTINFLGRGDFQVKVRGYRVELGEIEAALEQYADVHQAIVVARDEGGPSKHLAAYIVTTGGQVIAASELRAWLLARLPIFMVPETFTFLPAFPLTPNNKIDRRALPAPAQDGRAEGARYVAPTTPIQRQLVDIWESLLPVQPIGITANFFEIGGYSLLAARLIKRIDQAFGKRIPLATLFHSATIAQLADLLAEQPVAAVAAMPVVSSTLVPIQTTGTRPPFFFLPADWNGGGFYCLEMARDLGPDQPLYVLDPQVLGADKAPLTLAGLAAVHVASVRAVQPQGPYYLGGFCIGGLLAFEMARQLHEAGQTVAQLIMIDPYVSSARIRLARRIIDRRRRLTRMEKIEWFLRLRHVNTLIERAGVRERQLLSGRWRELLQREQLEDVGVSVVEELLAREWMGIYTWVAAEALPTPYPGKVTLLWARQTLHDEPHDWQAEWQRWAGEVELRTIPGSHLTCVTRHIHELSGQIKQCLTREEQCSN